MKELVRAVRDKISNQENWLICAPAWRKFDVSGRVELCHPRHPEACAWCLGGAIEAVADGSSTAYHKLRSLIEHTIPGGSIVVFNDSHTHAEVLAFLDRLIEETP